METLTITEWAKREKVTRRTAYRWAKDRKLPTIKREITVLAVPTKITKSDIGKGKDKESV
jgi:predicted site-specific integrase-resolvase